MSEHVNDRTIYCSCISIRFENMLRCLLAYFIVLLIIVESRLDVERRSLIPMTLRRKLCEKTRRAVICNIKEVSSNKLDDVNYSKWSICKHSPELMFCKWNPSRHVIIPTVLTEESHNLQTAYNKSPYFTARQNKPSTTLTKSFKNDNYVRTNSDLRLNNQQTVQKSASPKNLMNTIQPRFEGKLNVEREATIKSRKSAEEDEFNENIMLIDENVFGH
ncbi:hypothetical protein DICVIV_04326 [Dictyocaulus viviparus]|uniref:Uncharacterized protein n=1 Tax=Dictyocaulus viviparus TaxID=29172 RepID=A0A0D8XXZ7_DICVI|nr:hypothetical protein DICVIV_04326 [Dictyocaulus viviparus]